jgi:hypothetical protein
MLMKNDTLENLSLGGNKEMTETTVVSLMEALKSNRSLKTLELRSIGKIGSVAYFAIAQMLKVNSTLSEFDLPLRAVDDREESDGLAMISAAIGRQSIARAQKLGAYYRGAQLCRKTPGTLGRRKALPIRLRILPLVVHGVDE